MPKSTADIPFLSCSCGFILSEDKTTAKKFEPLITLEELTYDVMSFLILFLKSFAVISVSDNLSKFVSLIFDEQLYLVIPVHESQSSWHKPNSKFTGSKYQFVFFCSIE